VLVMYSVCIGDKMSLNGHRKHMVGSFVVSWTRVCFSVCDIVVAGSVHVTNMN